MKFHLICTSEKCRFTKTIDPQKKDIEIYCPKCSADLIHLCPHCQRLIQNPGAEFCSFCGKRLIQ